MEKSNYPVGDFLIRVKNAALSGKRELTIDKTKLIKAVAEALKREGLLSEVKEAKGKLNIALTIKSKEPVFMDIKLVSRPGMRVYMSVDELEKKKGPQVFILSTPGGILTSREALKKRIGGEVIAKIY